MANTLFDHGLAEYHFHTTNVNFPQSHAAMRQTEHERTKPSKLELLQEDYRSKLLHEREQKANALFEQKVRADLLPKQGSVREFFLNRRMLASTTTRTAASNGGNLPPIKTNTRYKDNRKDKTKIAEKQLIDERKKREKEGAITFLKDLEKEDNNLSELERLREKYRKSKTQSEQGGVPAMNMAEKSLNPTFSSTCDPRMVSKDATNTSLRKARGARSREVYKRGGKPSHEGKKERNTNSEELESSFAENNNSKVRGVKVYKRGRKPSHEGSKERKKNPNTNTNSEDLASSVTENEVSKSLVKIKELVHRRKTEELILQSTKFTTESDTPAPRRNSQSFDEMCKAEIQLRKTISREQKKLLALQERRKQKVAENMNQYEQESHKEFGGKQSRSPETKRNALRQRKEQNMKKIKKAETTQGTESKPNEGNNGNYSSSVDVMIDLVTCSNCGRGFMKERIERHQKACRKASARVKKPFDAKRKRAEGTDMEKYIIIGKEMTDETEYKEKKRNWRKTHENFIQSIRSARRQEPQPATPLSNPDYIECSYCQRKFKPTVAERHIPRCKDIKARPRPPRR